MHILFLSHYYPPEVNAPASRTAEHCQRWVEAGHEVTVITCVPNCPDGVVFGGYANRFRRQEEVRGGVRVVRVWTYIAPNSGTVRRVINYLSFMITAVWASLRVRRPDVIIATSPQFFCGWAGVLASWLRRRPFVLEIRDIWPESIEAVGAIRFRPLLGFLEWLERRMYLAADHIVAVGKGYRDHIVSRAPVADRISIITNGVDLEQFSPQQDRGAQEYRRECRLQQRFICSYIGTIGMAHGLDVVLDAAEMLASAGRRDIAFLLVGDGAERARLEAEAGRRGLAGQVIFAGRQPRERMPTVLAASDACLVHLKGTELFGSVIPSKIFETMAMGRPIIMGVRGEALRIVLDARAGLEMEPDSPESLVECVRRLADEPALRAGLCESGRAYVQEHFDRDELAGRYLKLLQRFCPCGSIDAEAVETAGGSAAGTRGSASSTAKTTGLRTP